MKTVRLGSIAESLPCDYGDDPSDDAPSFDVVKVSNVNGEGQFHGDFEKRRFRDDQIKNLLVKEGELLVVKSSGSKANILSGKTAICGADRAGQIVASNFLLRLRVDESTVVPRYVWYVLNSGASKAFVKTIVGASTYPNLKWSSYASHPIPLPPLAEQRRIAEVLDRAEALRAKRRAALAQLDSLTQSLFLDLFGDPATNPKRWPLVRLGEHTTKIGSGSTPTGGETAYKTEGISLIRSLNVRDGEFTLKDLAFIDNLQAAKLAGVVVEADDVLLNITGASVARVCRAPSSVLPARVNQHVCIIRPKPTLNAVFLEQFLLAEQTKRRLLKIGGAGATREAITKAQIEVFEAICPPIAQQREFARRVTVVEKLKAAQRASLAELDALFATLQHRAFRGEL